MRKKKYRFACNEKADNIIQPPLSFQSLEKKDYVSQYFNNHNPIVIEIGCGNGEYTIELAKSNKNNNYVGIDIKGDRIWVGSQKAALLNLKNVLFLRTMVQNIPYYLNSKSVISIYINFPDPRLKVGDIKKRLTSPKLLDMYKDLLIEGGLVQLKTDDSHLFEYTIEQLVLKGFKVIEHTYDLYNSELIESSGDIQTKYERIFLSQGKSIKYLKSQS